MGKTHEEISSDLAEWIREQHLFFVATAPLASDGHVNVSPKGLDTFHIAGPRQVAYLDLTGSGAETIAHLRENGRIVLMFCAFSGAARIVRLHGKGTVVTRNSAHWDHWLGRFAAFSSARAVIVVDVTRVSTSCGFGVAQMEFQADRDTLVRWGDNKGQSALSAYRAEKNRRSVDGLSALDQTDE